MKRFAFAALIIFMTSGIFSNNTYASTNFTHSEEIHSSHISDQWLMESLIHLISEEFSLEQDEIFPNSNFYIDLGFDFLDVFDLACICEDYYEIIISVNELDSIQTVQNLHDIILPKLFQ